MKVELINVTQDALELLLYTKNNRLDGVCSIDDIKAWSKEKKDEHFQYMLGTIQSSFEFVDYTFRISGVSRSFTHQLVRTRTASFAQEAQRAVDVRDAGFDSPPELKEFVEGIFQKYADSVDAGMERQDAREILPTGAHTAIIVKVNLRTLHNMGLLRLCKKASGHYQEVFKDMKKLVAEVHPWAGDFIQVHCAWYGVCAFPNYDDCPVKKHTIDFMHPKDLKESKEKCRNECESTSHVANPIAKNGKA